MTTLNGSEAGRHDALRDLIEPGMTSKSPTTRMLAEQCYDAARAHMLIRTHIAFLGKLHEMAHEHEKMLHGWRVQLIASLLPLLALLVPLRGAGSVVVSVSAIALSALLLLLTIPARVLDVLALRRIAEDMVLDERAVGDLPHEARDSARVRINVLHPMRCAVCRAHARVCSVHPSLLYAVARRDQRPMRFSPWRTVHLSCLASALRDLHRLTEKEAERDLRELGNLLVEHVHTDIGLGAIDLARRDIDSDIDTKEKGIA